MWAAGLAWRLATALSALMQCAAMHTATIAAAPLPMKKTGCGGIGCSLHAESVIGVRGAGRVRGAVKASCFPIPIFYFGF